MSAPENIDVDLYATKQEAVQAAIDACEDGDNIVVCRGNWSTCASGRMEACEFCARVRWAPGLTADEVLQRAAAS
ncbi:hypothetical protein DK419_13110 [Methylobacterium terrae]|uniref:Uncharacterized protein n=1 Tax=Methylobacterium terrae TaxID=2202827 RepID=A0A2U8WLK7_9HYPH|nr:hypothetical protein [Methylobacterium terrae]AWN47135.1 hypothetical protein DK419_13110 [Methylobacterium terrae]